MKLIAFGEILWDKFDNKLEIGGAPLNFSAHFVKLGGQANIISSIGNDSLGDMTIKALQNFCIEQDFISISPLPTGICHVSISEAGFPVYDLIHGVAYDSITLQEKQVKQIQEEYNILYLGTLAQRSETSRNTLNKILLNSHFHEVFCDLNIRQQYYNTEVIKNCLEHCTILKVSREEYHIFETLKIVSVSTADYDSELDFSLALCKALTSQYSIKIIIITMDKDGALLYDSKSDNIIISEKPKNKAVSTVGAGDSFSACFLYNYLQSVSLKACINRAVALSDFVVTRLGAVPEYPSELLNKITDYNNK